jgi:hypothetical protein
VSPCLWVGLCAAACTYLLVCTLGWDCSDFETNMTTPTDFIGVLLSVYLFLIQCHISLSSQIKVRPECPGGDCRFLDVEHRPCINHILALVWMQRECNRGSAWNHLGSAMSQGARSGTGSSQSGSCTSLSVRECPFSCSPLLTIRNSF